MSRENAPKKEVVIQIITDNRKAKHNYFLEDRFEAGMVLSGTEVKSLRDGKADLKDSYAIFKGGELWLMNAHIAMYGFGNRANHETLRTRKLLLNKHELLKLYQKMENKGYVLIPVRMYFKGPRAKVELALAKGKKQHDKRGDIKDREAKREMDRLTKTIR